MWNVKIRELSKAFLETPDSGIKEYQVYKNEIVKLLDNMTPKELVDLAIIIYKRRTI